MAILDGHEVAAKALVQLEGLTDMEYSLRAVERGILIAQVYFRDTAKKMAILAREMARLKEEE